MKKARRADKNTGRGEMKWNPCKMNMKNERRGDRRLNR